jgi:PAS domain S-box-containing protein
MKAGAAAWGARQLGGAVFFPLLAFGLQTLFWDAIQPFAWFLFFPTVFICAWIGGMAGALVSTVISIALTWYFFIPPAWSFALGNPYAFGSIALFMVMGVLFGLSSERIRKANRETAAALAEVRAANGRITQLYEKTLELDELKSQFFANVSHELRTPLTLILGPLAKRLATPGLPASERRETEMMQRNARLLYRHVSDLLDAAKMEAGGMTVHPARADLAGLVRAMAAHFESLARDKAIDYTVTTPETLIAATDMEKVQRILLNLLSNAFKFTPDGGVVAASLREEGGRVVIEVRDNGPGVPADMREAVFERFRQVEGGAQRRRGGTGLGLAIVKEFAELHGGRASVAEAPSGGALFRVELPLTRAEGEAGAPLDPAHDATTQLLEQQMVEELAPAAPVEAMAIAPGDAPLILVVEDNPDMNAYIADALAGRYRVARAGDGQDGLDQALALRPDLILSDVMMPRMSGDEMVEELRRRPGMAEVPIVMLTAKADEALRIGLLKSGVQDYLSKPFSTEELLARVEGLVATHRRTVEQLRASEAALKTAQRLAGVGSWLWDVKADRHIWSDEIYRIYGRDPALPPAVYPEVQRYFTPESWARLAAEVEKSLAEGVPYECEAEVVCPDGARRWITARGEATRAADGTVLDLHGTVQDITEHKLAEREIRDLNANLERRVQERTNELSAANQELDSFAYAVSHDLRAPLRAMSGFSQALAEDYGDRLDGEARGYLDQIALASRKMGELIDGILTLSRSTRGELRRDPVDITAMAGDILAELARAEPARRVTAEVEPGLMAVGDARMLDVVLRNLLGNAWKYSAKTGEALIRVNAEPTPAGRCFCISDNGAGFDMAHANRLFQPFQRLHRQDEFPGIGIGLATVQRIVNRHGGEIRADGAPGRGATFRFSLALAETTLTE